MYLFPFFPLPDVIYNPVEPLWNAVYAFLILVGVVMLVVGVIMLVKSGVTGKYDPAESTWGWIFLISTFLIFVFHGWLILIVVMAFALYLILYWIIWRILLKNALVAIGLIK